MIMVTQARFTMGAEATCHDGVCGELTRVVVDPVARVLTHVVVRPRAHPGAGRLVPLDLVDATPAGVHVDCTLADFERLPPAEEVHFLSRNDGFAGYGAEQVIAWPLYGFDGGGYGMAGGMGMAAPSPESVVTDAVPSGEVSIRRGDSVHAVDGDIGRVQGLVIDSRTHGVTHVLLQEGHLWGRKQVTIPMSDVSAMTGFDDGIRLTITKKDVADLPAIAISAHLAE
jgi:hypothetical protein